MAVPLYPVPTIVLSLTITAPNFLRTQVDLLATLSAISRKYLSLSGRFIAHSSVVATKKMICYIFWRKHISLELILPAPCDVLSSAKPDTWTSHHVLY